MKVKVFRVRYFVSKSIFVTDERFLGNSIVHFLQNNILRLCRWVVAHSLFKDNNYWADLLLLSFKFLHNQEFFYT
jgi:hypothetical protein